MPVSSRSVQLSALLLLVLALMPAPARASVIEPVAPMEPAPERNVFDGDWLLVGAGIAAIPSYEGSDETSVGVVGGIMGNIGGIGISPRAAGLALDLVSDPEGSQIGVGLGPVVRYRMNRTGRVSDPVVARLGALDGVLEGGVAASATLHRVLNRHDMLSFGVDARWDIAGKGSGMVVAPAVSYFSPLSRGVVAGARVSATFVDDGYARYNHGIDAAGSAASGLPEFRGRGGFNDLNLGGFVAADLSGNFLDGGVAAGIGAIWMRLHGSAAETPLAALRGSRSQWFAGGGLSYTF